MFFDPVQQTKFFNSLSKMALESATSSMMVASSTAAQLSGAMEESYSEPKPKKKSKGKAGKKAKKSSKIAAPAVMSSSMDDMMKLAFAPMTQFLETMTPEKPAPKAPSFEWPMADWAKMNPFLSGGLPQGSKSPFPMMPFPMVSSANSAFPMMQPFMMPSGGSSFGKMPWETPWMEMMGIKRERSSWEKMADPFELGSNVIPFPSWPMKAAAPIPKAMPMMPEGLDPAKVAAGMMALFMTPSLFQAAGSNPWAAFGG